MKKVVTITLDQEVVNALQEHKNKKLVNKSTYINAILKKELKIGD